jgi:hypothetical protein
MGAEVRVGVLEGGADEARLEELALLLRQELLSLDVRSVETVRDGDAPPGTRGGLAAIAGLLSVSLVPGVQMVGAVVALVRDWLRRSGGEHTVELSIGGDKIVVTGASDEVQQQLVDAWVRKHSGTGA